MSAKPKKPKAPRAKGTGQIFQPKGSRYLWISYYIEGKRHYEGTKSTREGDAQRLLTDRLGDIQKGIPVTPKMGRKPLSSALKSVVNDQTMNDRESVKHTQRRIDKHLLKHFNANRLLASLTTNDLTEYAAARLEAKASAASVNQELAIVKRAFRLAVGAGELVVMPRIPMLALNNTRTGFFERSEFDSVRAALPVALRGAVTFSYLTGWRVKSEVLPLEWKQVDRDRQVIRLEPGTTKNKKARTLPYALLPELVTVVDDAWKEHEQLKAQGTICPFVFHRNGKQIKNFRKAWTAAGEEAECPAKLLHDFRRTAVRNLVRAGIPEKTAMGVTGHKTRSVFDRYDIVNEDDLRGALGKLAEASNVGVKRQGKVKRFARRAS